MKSEMVIAFQELVIQTFKVEKDSEHEQHATTVGNSISPDLFLRFLGWGV